MKLYSSIIAKFQSKIIKKDLVYMLSVVWFSGYCSCHNSFHPVSRKYHHNAESSPWQDSRRDEKPKFDKQIQIQWFSQLKSKQCGTLSQFSVIQKKIIHTWSQICQIISFHNGCKKVIGSVIQKGNYFLSNVHVHVFTYLLKMLKK